MGAAKNQPGLLSKSFEKSGAAGTNDPRPASQLSDRSSKGFDVSQYRMHLLKLKGAPYFTMWVNYRCSSVIDDSAASIAGGGGGAKTFWSMLLLYVPKIVPVVLW